MVKILEKLRGIGYSPANPYWSHARDREFQALAEEGSIESSGGYRRLPFFYGWVVLGVSFLALFATFGIRVSFGSYITSWEHEFGISRTVVTTISVLSFLTLAIAQPLIGKLNDHYGARTVLTISMFLVGAALLLCSAAQHLWQLAILYGVIVSLGLTGGSNITAAAVITRWFTARRGFAIGLTLSGMAVGQLAVVPLSLYLIARFGWRFTIGLVGLSVLAIFMPLMIGLIRSKPQDVGLKPYGALIDAANREDIAHGRAKEEGEGIWSVLRQRVFWQLAIPYFVCGFTDIGLVDTHYIPFAEGKGIPMGIIAFTFSLIAVFNILGTIVTGHLSDYWHRSKLLASIYFIRGGSILILLAADRPWLLTVFAIVYGATEMASIAPFSSLCAHLFRKNSIGVIFGLASVSHQVGGAIGSLVPGVVYDLTGSYTPVFLLSIVLLVAGAVMVSRVPDIKERDA
jgi:MFS family permease